MDQYLREHDSLAKKATLLNLIGYFSCDLHMKIVLLIIGVIPDIRTNVLHLAILNLPISRISAGLQMFWP